MHAIANGKRQPGDLRESTIRSLLGELDTQNPTQIVPSRELPPSVHTGERKSLSREERFNSGRVVLGEVGAHPIAVRRRIDVEIHDHQCTTRPKNAHCLTDPRATSLAEEVGSPGVNEIDRRFVDSRRLGGPFDHIDQGRSACSITRQLHKGWVRFHSDDATRVASKFRKMKAGATTDVDDVTVSPVHGDPHCRPDCAVDVLRSILDLVHVRPVPDVRTGNRLGPAREELTHERSDECVQDQPRDKRRREKRIQPVHDSAVARQEGAHVLDSEFTLDLRLDEVTQGSNDDEDNAE